MSLDVLIAELTRAAEQEADEVRAAAAERVRAIERAAAEHARQRRDSELTRDEAAHRLGVARETTAAMKANRQVVLETRARLLDQVFARAAVLLSTADAAGYQRAIPSLVQATTRYLEGIPTEIRCRPDIATQVQQLCSGAPQVRVFASGDADAGLLGQSGDGRIVVDNTLPALLARRRADLAVAVARRLEEG